MKEIKGDLLKLAEEGHFDVIVHGCNCFHNMGAGIAKQVRVKFGEAYVADRESPKGLRSKLGEYTQAVIYRGTVKFVVINAYTQHYPDASKMQCDYNAIRDVFKKLKVDFPNARIGYPLIGAGLAGGDWDVISKIIDRELDGMDHTVVLWDR